jgi:apolipoprotein N-acyltransferase
VTQGPRGLFIGVAVAALSGALASVAHPPADLGALAFVALVPLIVVMRGSPPRRAALLGFVFGLVFYGILLSWLLRFGVVAWLPLVAAESAYVAGFGALVSVLWRDDRPILTALVVAALWTAIDWFRATWPLGGFTWGGLGYTQHGNRLLLPLASITGVWGITFVIVAVNALLTVVLVRPMGERGRWGRAAAPLAVAAGLVVAPAVIPFPIAEGRAVDVALVQGSVPEAAANPLDNLAIRSREVAENHIRLHRTLASDPPDLVVWPENALDVDPTLDPVLRAEVAPAIESVGAPTLAGAITDTGDGRFRNEVLAFDGAGRIVGRYAKLHPVPFGEYVPFRSLFGWVDQLRAVPRDIVPGTAPRVLDVGGIRVGTPICFENTFPDLFRRFVANGATLMVVATNDSSYGRSPASREHVIFSQLRAVETGRWVVQAAISGESAVVDPRGRVRASTNLFTPAILRYSVPTSDAITPYVRLGDWFPWACAAAAAAALAAAVVRRRRRRVTVGDAAVQDSGSPVADSDTSGGE